MATEAKPRRHLSKPYWDQRRRGGRGEWVIVEKIDGYDIVQVYADEDLERARCKAGLRPRRTSP